MLRGTRSPQPRKLSASRSERGASRLSPPDPSPEHAMGQGLTARDPQVRWLLPANSGMLRRAQPARPYGTPRHRSTSQATLNSGNRTDAPTRAAPGLQGTERSSTEQAWHPAARTNRPVDTSTSTAPASRRSSLGLPCGARQCTEEDRRGLATNRGVHMIGTSEAERTAERHCEMQDDGLCV